MFGLLSWFLRRGPITRRPRASVTTAQAHALRATAAPAHGLGLSAAPALRLTVEVRRD